MTGCSDHLKQLVLDLVWSLWTELGVSGWARRHAEWAIDPEPLIIFTAALEDADPRLRDESTDWCVRYGRYISGARLRNLVRHESTPVRSAFGEYAATVNAYGDVRWPGASQPRAYRPTGRSRLDDFERPALIYLRLRALFGVGARAEIIRGFIAQPDGQPGAADLAADISYTKRNTEKEVESLRLAGLLRRTPVRNEHRYILAQRDELLAFIGSLPGCFPRWSSTFRILLASLDVCPRVEGLEPEVKAVEASRTIRLLADDLRQAGLGQPDPRASGPEVWTSFERWLLAVAAGLAEGRSETFRSLPT